MNLNYVHKSDFTELQQLGRGSFGIVFSGTYHDGKKYAIKELYKWNNVSDDDKKYFLREITIQSQVNHPAVLKLFGVALESQDSHQNMIPPIIVTPYMSNGPLNVALNESNYSRYTPTQKYIFLYGIACGMDYLHTNGIIHRDLKPSNIFLNDKNEPVIADFGLSRFLNDSDFLNLTLSNIGTPLFMAPEIIKDEPYDNKVDVYSYAMTAYQIISGQIPRINNSNHLNFQEKVVQGARPDLSVVPVMYRKFLNSMWSPNPKDRPSFKEICQFLRDPNSYFECVDAEVFTKYADSLDFRNQQLSSIKGRQSLDVLKQKADAGDIEACNSFGIELLSGANVVQNYPEAFNYFEKASLSGDIQGTYYLGHCYEKGYTRSGKPDFQLAFNCYEKTGISEGKLRQAIILESGRHPIKRNHSLAESMFKELAEQGMPNGILWYAKALAFDGKYEESTSLWSALVDQNNCDAIYEIAKLIEEGTYYPPNPEQAFQYYVSAATGCILAYHKVGLCYLNGFGTKKSEEKAIHYFTEGHKLRNPECTYYLALTMKPPERTALIKEAAKQFYGPACVEYAKILQSGKEMPPNYPKSIKYLKIPQDYGPAYVQLATIYKYGACNVPADDIKSFKYYKLAADLGDGDGYSGVGRFYETGRAGLILNINEAIKFYKLSVQKKSLEGCNYLARLIISRQCTEYDVPYAIHLMTFAADHGLGIAQHNLALLYRDGISVQPSKETAARYFLLAGDSFIEQNNFQKALEEYKLAIVMGNPDGAIRIGNIYSQFGNTKTAQQYYEQAKKMKGN